MKILQVPILLPPPSYAFCLSTTITNNKKKRENDLFTSPLTSKADSTPSPPRFKPPVFRKSHGEPGTSYAETRGIEVIHTTWRVSDQSETPTHLAHVYSCSTHTLMLIFFNKRQISR